MGEEDGALDIERQGSSSRRRGGSHRGVHPAPPPHYNTDGRPTEFSGPPRNPDLVIRDHRKFFSWLVPFFIIANVALFVVTMYYNDCPKLSPASKCVAPFLKRFSFQPFSENPLLGPSSITLEKMGALVISKVIHDNQGWRLISCIWLHAGVFHLLANMLSLLFIGIRLEQEFGFLRIGTVYLLSGFGGSLLSALFIQDRISVGASGALFGLLGAMLSELITNWTIYANKCAALTTLIVIVALNLAVGLLPHVDNFAHIGGFVSGFFLGFVFLMKPQYGWINRKEIPPGYEVESPIKSKHKSYQYVFLMVSFLILVAGFTAAVVMVFRGYNVNKHCSWCHYLSCVPTSKWSCNESASCQSYYSDNTNNTLVLSCQSNNKTQTYVGLDQSNSTLSQLCIQLCA